MRNKFLHATTVFLIIYAAIFYGMAEYIPLVKMVHQVGAALIFGLWMFSLWRSGRGWPVTPLDIPLWLLLGLATLSAALSREPRVSLEYTWGYFILVLIFYFFVDQIRQGRLRWILEGLFLFAGILVLISLAELLLWNYKWMQIAGLSLPPEQPHLELLLLDENRTAVYSVLLLPLAVGWAISSHHRDTRLGLGLLSIGLMGTLLFSQSRGGFLGAITIAVSTVSWAASTCVTRILPANSSLRRLPYLFIFGVIAVSIAATAGTIFMVVHSGSELVRTDLWYSAIRMFEDHPIFGVGPYQYGSTRYWYPNWINSVDLDGYTHPHSLIFHLLAELGIVGLIFIAWLILRMIRLWCLHWRTAGSTQRIRLNAIALMIAGFVAHNSVDTFANLRPLIVVLAMSAVVVAPLPPSPNTATRHLKRSPALLATGASILLVAQIAFIPLNYSFWKHQEATVQVREGNYELALSAIQKARNADPWLDLYALEEAYTLGLAAHYAPTRFLDQAITAHEQALERNPVWDVGWHNLASLYAQRGDLVDAIAAEQQAIRRFPTMPVYDFQLGVYLLVTGQNNSARVTLFRALELRPQLASSDFWSDPEFRERKVILSNAFTHFSDTPKLACDIAMYSGQVELAAQFHSHIESDTNAWNQLNYDAAWSENACVSCFYIPPDKDLITAESELQSSANLENSTHIKQAAQRALFLNGTNAAWANYILARLDMNQAPDRLNNLLFSAVPQPVNRSSRFSIVFYGISSSINILPQARTPVVSRYEYEPWLVLGERLLAAKDWETALQLYELILKLDPYDRTAQWQVTLLTERVTTNHSQTSAPAPSN